MKRIFFTLLFFISIFHVNASSISDCSESATIGKDVFCTCGKQVCKGVDANHLKYPVSCEPWTINSQDYKTCVKKCDSSSADHPIGVSCHCTSNGDTSLCKYKQNYNTHCKAGGCESSLKDYVNESPGGTSGVEPAACLAGVAVSKKECKCSFADSENKVYCQPGGGTQVICDLTGDWPTCLTACDDQNGKRPLDDNCICNGNQICEKDGEFFNYCNAAISGQVKCYTYYSDPSKGYRGGVPKFGAKLGKSSSSMQVSTFACVVLTFLVIFA